MNVGSVVFGPAANPHRDILADAKTSSPRAFRRPDGIPTRCDMSLMSAAELAITSAMAAVEAAGASIALTDAITLLSKARDRVAYHVESTK